MQTLLLHEKLTALFAHKKVGIWGCGATGQSILTTIAGYPTQIFVLEERTPSPELQALLMRTQALHVGPEHIDHFFEACDIIIPSPGIVLGNWHTKYPEKCKAELDIFGSCISITTIAITGSVGKTTTVTLLEQLLTKLGKRVKAIGNNGTPMFSFLPEQQHYDYAILELSSFQLEHSISFAPTLATILNIVPNHLDRHGSMEDYLKAKGNLLLHQLETGTALVPLEYMHEFWPFIKHQKVQWVGPHAYDDIMHEISDVTCKENLILILAILEQLGFSLEQIVPLLQSVQRPEHRMEFVTTRQGIEFYNDSKATVIESTLQALTLCHKKPVILLLGGLSKGTNRQPLIAQLPSYVKHVVCFGKEAQQLTTWCRDAGISSSCHATLEDAFTNTLTHAQPGDTVLFSPSGTSYDLFNNFEERGRRFKELVTQRR